MKNNLFQKHPVLSGVSILLLFLAISSYSIFALVKHEKQRDYDNWQITLGVMIDGRANAINSWLEDQFSVLNGLAQNGSVQLYTQQLMRRSDDATSEPAQISYLRTLLHATADKNNFLDSDQAASPIQANISFQANNGMALIDIEQKLITATPGVHSPDNELRQAILQVVSHGKPSVFNIRLNKNNQPIIGFLMPVYGLQVQDEEHKPIAVIYAFKNANDTLFPLLESKSRTTPSAETMLVMQEGEAITYLSPLADGTPALKKQLAANSLNIAAVYAVKHPGSFSELIDYSGTKVLSTSRTFPALPWILVQKIQVNEALSESLRHQQFLMMALFLTTLLVAALLVAAWWYGSNIRERKTTEELLQKSQELEAKTHLLDAINENISDFIILSDSDSRFIFANSLLIEHLGISQNDIVNKTISSVLGPDISNVFTPLIKSSLAHEKASSHSLSIEINGMAYQFHAIFSPVSYQSSDFDTVLITLHDVTKLQKAQENKANLMHQLIQAMMRAIDLHDPYSANHSAKTADIAAAVGRAMNLNQKRQSALETAANLCNIGKLFIAKEILTKTDKLTEEEQRIVQKETIFAREILSSIDFEGPVLETIAQKHERLDGSGYPEFISGDAILPTSRILSIANAFVAMISPRAYREGLTVEIALSHLLKEANTHYDRKVVAALFHVAENEIDWSTWHIEK